MVPFRNATIAFLLLIGLVLNVTCRNDYANPTNRLCNSGRGEIIEIGIINQGPKISVCFNPKLQLTYWTYHYLTNPPSSCQESEARWLDNFFNSDPSPLYSQSPSTDKGQFSPACDFDTKDEQDMTFYYINAAPQFRPLNIGNWKSLEKQIQDRVRKGNVLKIITGAARTLRAIQWLNIPEYFFKVVVTPTNSREVFIGFNTDASIQQNLCDVVIPNCGWTGRSTIICCDLTTTLLGRLGLTMDDVTY